MNPQRGQLLQQLFHELVDLDPANRAALLDERCGDDPDLREQLLRLLATDDAQSYAAADALAGAGPRTLGHILPGLLTDGQRIGAYLVERLLGSGGMGQVYAARRSGDGIEQRVAIKLVRPDRMNPAVLARFSSERRMLAALTHPGICSFIDAGVINDAVPYVVMEYIEGQPLDVFCRERRLRIDQRLMLLRKVCAAVAHAHSRTIVHRDIKLANILVGADGEPRLLDFGIGKSIDVDDPAVTATRERFLTPVSAAPEQLRGEPAGIGVDIYALGALAYELLSGRPPFQLQGLSAAEVERQILSVPPPLMSEAANRATETDTESARQRGFASAAALSRRLSGDLDIIVARCLRKSPDERYRTVLELDAELQRHLEGKPIVVRSNERLYRLRRFVGRHRSAVILVSLLAASLIGGALAVSLQALELARRSAAVTLERDRAQQVVDLLREAFAAADPARVAGDDVRARHVLDAAAHRLDALFGEQPELYVALAETIASVELDLASDSRAATLAQQALTAAERFDAAPAQLRQLRLIAARGLTGMGDLELAQAHLDGVRASDTRLAPDWAIAQARLLFHRADAEAAVPLLQQAERMLESSGSEHRMLTDARWQLSEALRWANRPAEAMGVLQATLAWQLQYLDANHPDILLTRMRHMNLLSATAPHSAAIPELQQLTAEIMERYGARSSMAGKAHQTLASAYHRADRVHESIEEDRRAWLAWRMSLGEGDANTLRAGRNLASALAADKDTAAEGERLLRELLSVAEDSLAPERDLLIYIRVTLANALVEQKRWDEALELMSSSDAAQGHRAVAAGNRRVQAQVLATIASAACDAPEVAIRSIRCFRITELLQRLRATLPDGHPPASGS